jgi:hypothetical protein
MTRETVSRRADRRSVVLRAQCRTQSGLRDLGSIADLTAEGCCVITNELFVRVGARVIIRPEGMEGLSGVVRWVKGNRAGVEFDSPLYGPVVDHLVSHHAGGGPAPFPH